MYYPPPHNDYFWNFKCFTGNTDVENQKFVYFFFRARGKFIWTQRLQVDIKFPMKARVSMKKIVYYYVCKNWRKFIICAHVKWSILPHLNVKRYSENVGNEGNNCFHFVHNCQHNLNGIYIYHGIRCQEYILTPYFIISMQV